MQTIILKNNISKPKMEALINFLNNVGIKAEVLNPIESTKTSESEFSLSVGIWKNYNIDSIVLRRKAWSKK